MFSNGQIVVVEMGFGGYLIGIYSLTNLNHTWSNLGICFASVSEWYDAWNCISPNPQFTSPSSSPLGPLVESPKTQYTDKVGRVPLIPNSQRINEVTNPLGSDVESPKKHIFRGRCIMSWQIFSDRDASWMRAFRLPMIIFCWWFNKGSEGNYIFEREKIFQFELKIFKMNKIVDWINFKLKIFSNL